MKQHLNINRGTIFHRKIKVYGLVQGIFFRATAKERADKLGITGFAQNEDDGTVYIEAEGEKEDLDKFTKWCNIGPPMAQVEKVVVTEGQLKDFSKFGVY